MRLSAQLILEPITERQPFYAILRTPIASWPVSIAYTPDITRLATEIARTHGFTLS